MATAAVASSFGGISGAPLLFETLLSRHSFYSPPRTQFIKKSRWGAGKVLLLGPNYLPEQPSSETEQQDSSPEQPTNETEQEDSRTTVASPADDGGVLAYANWYAALGGLGFLETLYLTYLKFTHSDAFCPAGGGACGGVLNSEYSVVFGVPLPLIGMLAYGTVATLGLQLGGKRLPFDIAETNIRSIILATTTSMAVASAYFLYILSTKFPGESCIYCLASAFLSLCLFFITLKNFWSRDIQREVVLLLSVVVFVVTALTTSYNTSQPVSTSSAEIDLPYIKTEVTMKSSPLVVSLARHLRSIGAKMYGAFWCSHCLEQKEMFGREATEILDYVECFPDGYRKGTKMAKACTDAKIEGFPTWVIKGEVLSGELDLAELARASGVELEKLSRSN